jgi:hypothetical protein
MFLLTNAYGETKKIEYFSYATLCNGKNNSIETKLLDFIESKTLRNQEVNPLFLKAQSEEEIFKLLNENLKNLSPLRSASLIETYLHLKKTMVISDGISIAAPAEADNLINLDGCTLTPIAASLQTTDSSDNLKNRIIVNKKIWGNLKLYEQVAVVLDFALAEEIQEENLIPSRIFSGYWFSESFKAMDDQQWEELTEYLHLPYFEFHGVKLTNLHTESSGTLYKNNFLTINNQRVHISGHIYFYPDTMNIESVSITDPVEQKTSAGDTLYLYGAENKYDSIGNMFFFNTPELKIMKAFYKVDGPFKFYDHLILADNPTLKYEIWFSAPNTPWRIDLASAKITIRNKIYSITGRSDDSDYVTTGNVWLYPNGTVSGASMFVKNQKFDLKNGKSYVNDYMHVMDFDKDGFVGK